MKKLNELYQEPNDATIESEEDEFEIGQGYEGVPVKKLICKKCGSGEWIVGQGSYYTAIKCPKCLYELTIHTG